MVKEDLNNFLETYTTAYYKCLKKPKTFTTKFKYDPKGKFTAYCTQSEIVVNLNFYPALNQIFVFIKNLITKNFSELKSDPIFRAWFGPDLIGGKAATLNHELEHARRNEEGEKSMHDPAKDAHGNDAKFEQCAVSFAKKAYDSGLLDEWSKLLRSEFSISNNVQKISVQKMAMATKYLERSSDGVKVLEDKNKSELCKRLG